MQQVDAYPFIVRKLSDEEGGGYLVEYPDIHYCIADGKTPEDAVRNGRKALEACLATKLNSASASRRQIPRCKAANGVSASPKAFTPVWSNARNAKG
jgi:predicted RNase H-like HicB family nuclease